MQFYQGCELLSNYNHLLREANKFIASIPGLDRPQDVQKIAGHVWKTRHTYFGHRGQLAILSAADVHQVAKQVLVARWLCRTLLDGRVGLATPLIREMRWYFGTGSENFRGSVQEIEGPFLIPGASGYPVPIFNATGKKVGQYALK